MKPRIVRVLGIWSCCGSKIQMGSSWSCAAGLRRGPFLEGQPQLRLELPVSSLVVRQVSEISRCAVDREYGRYRQRIWMVQHVSCVHPELDRFRFTNFE